MGEGHSFSTIYYQRKVAKKSSLNLQVGDERYANRYASYVKPTNLVRLRLEDIRYWHGAYMGT